VTFARWPQQRRSGSGWAARLGRQTCKAASMATFLERASRLLSGAGGVQLQTPAICGARQPGTIQPQVRHRGRHVQAQHSDAAMPSDDAFDAFYDTQLSANGSPENGTTFEVADFRPTKCACASSSMWLRCAAALKFCACSIRKLVPTIHICLFLLSDCRLGRGKQISSSCEPTGAAAHARP
jgi:hypothetical protein